MNPTRPEWRKQRRASALALALLAAWLPGAGPRAASLPTSPGVPSTARFT